MILKLLGAMLTIIATSVLGFQITGTYMKEIKQIKRLIFALEYMENELSYRKTPLPELFENLTAMNIGLLGKVFEKTGCLLNNQISSTAGSCLNIALSETDGLFNNAIILLKQLSDNLGKFDVEGQISGIHSVKEECGSVLKVLETNKAEKIRSIKTLCVCAGAAVAILLI